MPDKVAIWTDEAIEVDSLNEAISNPQDVYNELQQVRKKHGEITPENALEFAKDKTTHLHKLLDWNDTEAANKFRLLQLRWIIHNVQVTVVSNGEPKEISVTSVRSETEEKEVRVVRTNDIKWLKGWAFDQLEEVKNKISGYNNFANAILYLNDAMTSIVDAPLNSDKTTSREILDNIVKAGKFYHINGKNVKPKSWKLDGDMVVMPCEVKEGGSKIVKFELEQINEIFTSTPSK